MSHGSIQLFSQEVAFKHPQEKIIISWIERTLLEEHQNWAYINIIFCSDEYLLSLNQQYLQHDYYTDIITFQYEPDPIEGELFISLDRVKENASNHQIKWPIELHRVIIHGILHLSGYGDKTDSEIHLMREKEDHYLNELSASAPTLTLDKF